ncbi:hypothetical protein X797_010678 [Metarhizium robertsii]|uniref:Uncharacterized protein n=2 Tax=Metarhizium robertsii TaxID=568076 RepID=E9FBQ9_METRA|nr:uncharacterized protein MAA_09708 [Metarhizium robertsii ARSEF 23]EFY94878.1 hypothetical protein MAA_09708 [Metarhizium robertsii ARSEF 23]EXU96293.1 hypothetical protein X797_010678 [Metarhizium robertsii]
MKASLIATLVGASIVAAECPSTGSTDSQGRFSCNPAHQYGGGQTCEQIDGCFYLLGPDGKPVINSPAEPSETAAACPSTGSTDSQGRFSCNPAHQYGGGQTCGQIDGCFYLLGPDGKPVINSSSTTAQPPVVTAGASFLQGAGALALAVCGLVL